MSLSPLPDELISAILSPALHVPDDAFAASSSASSAPFARFCESTSAYLLVCKAWLRVATPLLYGVVILRSRAQAKALAKALRRDPQLGGWVRKLRVEGGYGTAMQGILANTPNVEHLFLTLNVFAGDNTEGLCAALDCISPTKLILEDDESKTNFAALELHRALVKIAPQWNRLTSLDLSNARIPSERTRRLLLVIAPQTLIHTVVVALPNQAGPVFIALLDCPLRCIRVKLPIPRNITPYINEVKKVFGTRPISLEFEYLPAIHRFASRRPHFIPMEAEAEEVQDAVWSRIFQFLVHELENNGRRSATRVLLVCRRFLRLGTPPVYNTIYLKSPLGVERLARTISSNPTYGGYIKKIVLRSVYSTHAQAAQQPQNPTALFANLRQILASASGLTSLVSEACGVSVQELERKEFHIVEKLGDLAISFDAFRSLARLPGAQMREMTVEVTPAEGRLDVMQPLVAFTSLTRFVWRSRPGLEFEPNDAVAAVLPVLEELAILEAHPSFSVVMGRIRMPALRKLTLLQNVVCLPLLEAHGTQLTILCTSHSSLLTMTGPADSDIEPTSRSRPLPEPHLVDHHLPVRERRQYPAFSRQSVSTTARGPGADPPSIALFDTRTAAQALTRMKFILPYSVSQRRQAQAFESFFSALAARISASMPRLAEVELGRPVKWPTTEHDIAKNQWVRTAEVLLDAGVQAVDHEGRRWRKRLGPMTI
ncbi:hypothetical protein HMN09_00353800 [Mycena chlorophos]|uniref:Uncharacterized protein n=1 Tax=Mycena chlorophos TaxID=658473 RepID=A0A8H6TKP3_MYCCL|nr:hypothetical protein HMN09_00353800 [Mycena chlorophos]